MHWVTFCPQIQIWDQLPLNLQRLQPMKVWVVYLRVQSGLPHLRRSCNSLIAAVCAVEKNTKAVCKCSGQCVCHCGRWRQNIQHANNWFKDQGCNFYWKRNSLNCNVTWQIIVSADVSNHKTRGHQSRASDPMKMWSPSCTNTGEEDYFSRVLVSTVKFCGLLISDAAVKRSSE